MIEDDSDSFLKDFFLINTLREKGAISPYRRIAVMGCYSFSMKRTEKQSWKCISQCGACCRLAPLERIEAIESLSPSQAKTYLKMVGENGWCVHYDTGSRSCKIYDERPDFCKVSNLNKFFKCAMHEPNESAISFCIQQINSVYGGRSKEMRRFRRETRLPKI